MSTVEVKVGAYARCDLNVRILQRLVLGWGSVTCETRNLIIHAAQAVNADTLGISKLSGVTVSLEVAKIKKTLALLAHLGTVVHSARHVMASDMRRALGLIKKSRLELQSFIQLDLPL